jgi:hypothetical protein
VCTESVRITHAVFEEIALRVEFRLKFWDLLIYNLMHQLCSITVHVFMALVSALMVYSFAMEGESLLVLTLVGILAYLAGWLMQLIFMVAFLLSSNTRTLLTEKVLELHEDALFEESRFNKSYHFWPGILKAVRRPGFIAIYTNGLAAHVIPNRAFSTDIDRDQFWNALHSRLTGRRQAAQ